MKKLLLALLLTSASLAQAQTAKTPCSATTKAGTPCKRSAAPATKYCKQHDPATPKCGTQTKSGQPCKVSVKQTGQHCHNHATVKP